MAKYTLKGFLSSYVQSLSFDNTLSIHKLYTEVYNGNSRLKEPLFLFCYHNNKQGVLFKYLNDGDKIEYNTMVSLIVNKDVLPRAYEKVYESFQYVANKQDNEQRVKKLLAQRINIVRADKHISNRQLLKHISVDSSNYFAFTKRGDVNRLSITKAKEILDYLEML